MYHFLYGQDDEFFNDDRSGIFDSNTNFLIEVGTGLPILSWAKAMDKSETILAPFEGRTGSNYQSNLYLKVGGESKYKMGNEKEDLMFVLQYALHGNLLNRMEWSEPQAPEIELKNQVWDAGIHLGYGLSQKLDDFNLAFIPSIYLPIYMSLPNYIVNPNIDLETQNEEWLNDAEKYTVYSDQNTFFDFVNSFDLLLGFGGEIRFAFQDRYFIKAEYYQMNVNSYYTLETENYVTYDSAFAPTEIIANVSSEYFRSDYRIIHLRLGLGIKI